MIRVKLQAGAKIFLKFLYLDLHSVILDVYYDCCPKMTATPTTTTIRRRIMTKNEMAQVLFSKLNLGKAYTLDENGYVYKKGMRYPFCFLRKDDFKNHILWLANKYLKRKVRTNAEKFNELVWFCDMCMSLATYMEPDSLRNETLVKYKLPNGLKQEIYKYIEGIIVSRTELTVDGYRGSEIAPLDEALVTAL